MRKENGKVYELWMGDSDNPFIASIPHSGVDVPDGYSQLGRLPNHDWHVDKLYDFLPGLGITTIKANYSRYLVDLNRELNHPLYGSFYQSVVAATDPYGKDIYDHPLSSEEINQRIEHYYRPYHLRLKQLLEAKLDRFGYAILVDLHAFGAGVDSEICMGNRNGQTCSQVWLNRFGELYSKHFSAVSNEKFIGGHITKSYASKHVQALQIEHCYDLYLTEDHQVDLVRFQKVKQSLIDIWSHLISADNSERAMHGREWKWLYHAQKQRDR